MMLLQPMNKGKEEVQAMSGTALSIE